MNDLVLSERKLGDVLIPGMKYAVEEIRKTWCPNATPSELAMFLNLAQANQLDPAKREIYFIKYDGSRPSYVTGYQVYLQRAAMSGKLDGWEITLDRSNGVPISATITIYRKGFDKPIVWTVEREEFDSGKANWKKMPSFMLKKVAIGQGMRLAFPEYLGGMPYLVEEILDNTRYEDLENERPVVPQGTQEKGKKGRATSTRKVQTDKKTEAKDVTGEVEVQEQAGEESQEEPEQPEEETQEPEEQEEPEQEQEEEQEQEPAPPVPDGVEQPAPKLLKPDDRTAIIKHFSKLNVTEETLVAVLEAPTEQWTESHRIYLQAAWKRLTDTDPKRKISVEDFAQLRYKSQAPF